MEAIPKFLDSYRTTIVCLPGQPPQLMAEPVYFAWMTHNREIWCALESTARALGRLDTTIRNMPMAPAFQRLSMVAAAVDMTHLEGGRIRMAEALHNESTVETAFQMDWLRVQKLVSGLQAAWTGPDVQTPFLRRFRSIHTAQGNTKGGLFRKGAPESAASLLYTLNHPVCPPAALPGLFDDLALFMDTPELMVPFLIRMAIADFQLNVLQPFEQYNTAAALIALEAEFVRAGWLSAPVGVMALATHTHATERHRLKEEIFEGASIEGWILAWLNYLESAAMRLASRCNRFATLVSRTEGPLLLPYRRKRDRLLAATRWLYYQPVVTASQLSKHLKVSLPTALDILENLGTCGITQETTGFSRNRIFMYKDVVALFH